MFPFRSLNHRLYQSKLVEHDLWKLSWHLQKFIFFLLKLCLRLIFIRIDLQNLGQNFCKHFMFYFIYIYLRFVKNCANNPIFSLKNIYLFAYLLQIEEKFLHKINHFLTVEMESDSKQSAIFSKGMKKTKCFIKIKLEGSSNGSCSTSVYTRFL